MIVAPDDLAARASRAYEHGRLRWALGLALAAAAVAAIALIGCPAPGGPATCLCTLGVVFTACLWRGGAWARGARLGYLAGLVPCWLPAAARAARACDGRICLALPPLCLAAGAVAGLLLGWLGARLQGGHRDRRFWLAAAAVATLAGATGCLPAGLAGLGGMALGLLAGAAVPVLAARAA